MQLLDLRRRLEMKQSKVRTRILVSAPIVALGIIGIGVASNGSSISAVATETPSFESQLKVLGEKQAKQDHLPEFIASNGSVAPETSRYLGGNEDNDFWLAKHKNSTLCVVSVHKAIEDFAGYACGDEIALSQSGIGTYSDWTSDDSTGASEAILIPDGYLVESMVLGKDQALSSNLLIREADNAEANILSLKPLDQSERRGDSLPELVIPDLSVDNEKNSGER